MKYKIVFLIPENRILGSTYLRGVQLSQILNNFFPEKIEASLWPLPQRAGASHISKLMSAARQFQSARSIPKNNVLYATKDCIEQLYPGTGMVLKERAKLLIYDYVDIDLDTNRQTDADIHLCSSFGQLNWLLRSERYKTGACELLLHGWDARLPKPSRNVQKETAVYWGDPSNCALPKKKSVRRQGFFRKIR